MKKIEAIIRPEKLEPVRAALEEKGISGMTVIDVKGRGRQKGVVLRWRAGSYKVSFLPKVKLEIVVADEDVDKVLQVICDVAKTGRIGDGKIFISTIDDAIRVRTKERGENAL